MARGWESKAVEGQVEEFHKKEDDNAKKRLSPAQTEIKRQREVLKLSRVHLERQLNGARDGRYREQLTRALSDLDAQIAKLK